MFLDREDAQAVCEYARIREANLSDDVLSLGQVRQILLDHFGESEPVNPEFEETCKYLFDNLSEVKSSAQIADFLYGPLEDLLIETTATFQRALRVPLTECAAELESHAARWEELRRDEVAELLDVWANEALRLDDVELLDDFHWGEILLEVERLPFAEWINDVELATGQEAYDYETAHYRIDEVLLPHIVHAMGMTKLIARYWRVRSRATISYRIHIYFLG